MINIYIFYCERSAVSGQRSAVRGQPSAVSGQPSADLTQIKRMLISFIQKLKGKHMPYVQAT
ncbi:hypothetical protein [Moorena sp. SIO3B2]|uniref:hypothetical protein n=1 Tax=Moorena sp. SIO3B2 TaxID=2607827 RepID=UPI0013CCB9E9|nr:hypothetical protein [Moorena sp. SIO3B2]NEP36989.1 hypothetical protein [Moorena sp. SIO3B2]